MKKILCIVAALMLTVSVCACSKNEPDTADKYDGSFKAGDETRSYKFGENGLVIYGKDGTVVQTLKLDGHDLDFAKATARFVDGNGDGFADLLIGKVNTDGNDSFAYYCFDKNANKFFCDTVGSHLLNAKVEPKAKTLTCNYALGEGARCLESYSLKTGLPVISTRVIADTFEAAKVFMRNFYTADEQADIAIAEYGKFKLDGTQNTAYKITRGDKIINVFYYDADEGEWYYSGSSSNEMSNPWSKPVD